MNKKFKRAGATLALLLVGAAGAAGSLAYLQKQSDAVTNTFTAVSGLIDSKEGVFTLDETKVKWDKKTGNYVADTTVTEKVTANTYDNILPGLQGVMKDPTVTLKKVTADSYLFVTVKETDDNNALTWAIEDTQWEALRKDGEQVTKDGALVYVKKGKVTEGTENLSVPVLKGDQIDFGNFGEQLAEGTNLVFNSYLTQSTGFTDAADAWSNTYGQTTANTPATPEAGA
ncbi:hypothetical protein [Ileibacterium valens]|uniref:hypothetical protein n=1 Tax=Ileibacterium valens TaxID=1862668 RepID=UPI00259BAC7B|nr:hypothetical protein [Ileibacterium valens]